MLNYLFFTTSEGRRKKSLHGIFCGSIRKSKCWWLSLCSALSISASAYGAVQDSLEYKNYYGTLPLKIFKLNSAFGIRTHPVTGQDSFHKGIDIAGKNEVVASVLPGIIDKTGYSSIMGNYVAAKYGGYIVYYAHLSKVYCSTGHVVPTGYPIGLTGSTGRTTGEHLHLSVHRGGKSVNPLYFLLIILSKSGGELKRYLYGG